MKEPLFLTLAELIEIHKDQITRYGGSTGIRDINVLSSAAAMPYASCGDQFLHHDIFEMAAAYAYHISQNHPFIDGNKRTALAAALIFLELNGVSITDTDGELYDAMIHLVTDKLSKAELGSKLKRMV